MEFKENSSVYLYELSQYKRFTATNHLLKKMQGNSRMRKTMLDVFTLHLIEGMAAKILQKCFEFFHCTGGQLPFIAV